MTYKRLNEICEEREIEVTIFGNGEFDGCIIGLSTDDRAVYSLRKMVEWLMEKDSINDLEALDAIEYNTIRSLPYQENPPVILDDLNEEEE